MAYVDYKIGDTVIVIKCSRNNIELGWTGTVVRFDTYLVYVTVDRKEYSNPIAYHSENIRICTSLDKALQ